MKRKSPNQTFSDTEKILWMKNRTKQSDGCWEWTSTLHKVGYGKVQSWLHSSRYAHRAMYSLAVAPIQSGMYVLHACDNRKCINPDHLWLGTHAENQQDKKAKGRHNWKFSDEDIAQLRRFHSYGIARAELLPKFGISTFWFDKVVKEHRRTGDAT